MWLECIIWYIFVTSNESTLGDFEDERYSMFNRISADVTLLLYSDILHIDNYNYHSLQLAERM